MARPLIALLTDFGLHDHYVGTMKGVALGICPEVTFVDICHDVAPQDVLGGAVQLSASYGYFPPSTVFLVVVDPGVGSLRRGIAVDTGDYRFVAPDNGVLSIVLDERPPKRVIELSDPRYARATVSKTFEGRDRFAPAAAWLASGLDVGALGPLVSSPMRLSVPTPRGVNDGIDGEVLAVDRFGNLITNIDAASLRKLAGAPTVRIAIRTIPCIVSTYADVPPGELCALIGSSDRLEISVNGGNAAKVLSAGRGAPVQVRRAA